MTTPPRLAAAVLAAALAGAGVAAQTPSGPRVQSQVARTVDVAQMIAALPDRAPAAPKQSRRVLVLGRAAGFIHATIPLAARTIEALGQKTGAWTTVITYSAADVTAANLQQYDAIVLASTTGKFLDDGDAAASAERRKALFEFVRGGKGLVGIHAATDAYHGNPSGGSDGPGGGEPLWPEFIKMIGGYFKWHWNYPTMMEVRVEDPANPINAAFTTVNQAGERAARAFSIADEVYTFNQQSWVRNNVRVLTSIDYAKMPAEVKAQEPAPQRTDHDYPLSYIHREGSGRVFVQVLGHDESIYKLTPMLAHLLAGVQYAIGDLAADDSPRPASR